MVDYNQDFLVGPYGEDQILYTAEYAQLLNNKNEYTGFMAGRAISTSLINEELPVTNKWSFDMHYGMVCLSKQYDFVYHKRFWWGQIHYLLVPRDLILFAFATEGIFHYLSLPFLWIASLWMILGLSISSYKTINGKQVLATDFDLITRLYLNTFNMPITKKICDYIAKNKYGGYNLLIETYFGLAHPITLLTNKKE